MNNETLNNNETDKKNLQFKIYQIKLTHFYWDGDDKDYRYPVSTSVELYSNYDYQLNKIVWTKKIIHKYNMEKDNEILEEVLINENTINQIEKLDLLKYKNNYFTDKEPEKFTYWEINYNTHFYIVGTYDQEIESLKELYKIFNMKDIISNKIEEIKEKVKNEYGA